MACKRLGHIVLKVQDSSLLFLAFCSCYSCCLSSYCSLLCCFNRLRGCCSLYRTCCDLFTLRYALLCYFAYSVAGCTRRWCKLLVRHHIYSEATLYDIVLLRVYYAYYVATFCVEHVIREQEQVRVTWSYI